LVSGYSFGSAMAWRYICEDGNDVAALLGISGSLDQDVECPQAPRKMRDVHGTNDTVMGFPFGTGGDTTYPVKLWRDKFDCGVGQDAGAWNVVGSLTFQRTTWEDCGSGQNVALDIQPGGHFIPHVWIGRQLDELLGRAPTYPLKVPKANVCFTSILCRCILLIPTAATCTFAHYLPLP